MLSMACLPALRGFWMPQQQLPCAGSSARLCSRTVIWLQLLKQSREGARATGHALQTACVCMLQRPWCRLDSGGLVCLLHGW